MPANNGLSIRHTTRNFPNREGSKPGDGQLSGVLLLDARSIAATANHGVVTSAAEVDYPAPAPVPAPSTAGSMAAGCTSAMARPDRRPPTTAPTLPSGPPSRRWGELLLQVASVLRDPVTTTDELIPSGETSSYRSDPLKLASFALSRRDPDYVPRAKATQALEETRRSGAIPPELQSVQKVLSIPSDMGRVQIGSVLFANRKARRRLGTGSRPPPASGCWGLRQPLLRVCHQALPLQLRQLGMLPFTLAEGTDFPGRPGDFLYVPQGAGKR